MTANKLPRLTSSQLRLVLNEAGSHSAWPNPLVSSIDSALISNDIERAVARLKGFKAWPDDWDGEGSEAPSDDLIDAAMAFLVNLHPWHPRPIATLDHKGRPVVEFPHEEIGGFAHVRFLTADNVELFVMKLGDSPTSCEGSLSSEIVLRFLSNEMQITLRRDKI